MAFAWVLAEESGMWIVVVQVVNERRIPLKMSSTPTNLFLSRLWIKCFLQQCIFVTRSVFYEILVSLFV